MRDTEQTNETTAKSDPWKAVHRIKLKHQKVIEAAITVVNCYQWQGEQQAQYLAEAINELDKAVADVTPNREPPASMNECADDCHFGDHDAPAAPERGEWRMVNPSGAVVRIVEGENTTVAVACGNSRKERQQHAVRIITEHNQHSTLSAQREQLVNVLRRARAAAQIRSDLNERLHGRPAQESWVDDADAVLTTSEQEGRR